MLPCVYKKKKKKERKKERKNTVDQLKSTTIMLFKYFYLF